MRLDAASYTESKFLFDLFEYQHCHLKATFASRRKELASWPEKQTVDLERGFSADDI